MFYRPSPGVLNRATKLGSTSRRWGRIHAAIFAYTGGRVLRRWVGLPVLVLETTGRRTGARRATPVLRFDDGDDFVVIAANAGSDRTPAWYLNVRQSPDTTVLVAGKRWRVKAEIVDADERARLWPRLVSTYGGLAEYQRFTSREFPIVRLRRLGEA